MVGQRPGGVYERKEEKRRKAGIVCRRLTEQIEKVAHNDESLNNENERKRTTNNEQRTTNRRKDRDGRGLDYRSKLLARTSHPSLGSDYEHVPCGLVITT